MLFDALRVSRARPGNARPWVLAVIGPTGAGKTTTAAKLALHAQAYGTQRVGFVTLDTYRVGAIDQLQAYARLVQVPFAVAYEEGDIPEILRRMRDREVLLVDTPGRSPREEEDEEEILGCLRALLPDEVHLTLPAGFKPNHMTRLVTRARRLGVTHLLPTKVDEYPDDNTVFALAAHMQLPIRWIADGHRVPQDLRLAPADVALTAGDEGRADLLFAAA